MMPGTDLIALEIRTREIIGEEQAALWKQNVVFSALNGEIHRLSRMVIDLDNGYLEQILSATPVAGAITLPIGCYVVRALDVSQGGAYIPLNWTSSGKRFLYGSGSSVVAVRFEGSKLVFESTAASVGTVRVHYGKLPAPLLYGAAAAGGASSITLASDASPLDDAYNGAEGLILDGAGLGQSFEISDYVGSTKVATVSAWGTAIDNTSQYSFVLPTPLDKFPDVVSMGAALRLLWRRRDADLTKLVRDQYLDDRATMLGSLRRRQTSEPSRVNHIPDYDELFGE